MRIAEDNNTFISPIDKYGKISNQQIFLIAKSSYGKGLTEEGIIEFYHKMGYLVCILSDPKKELELAYQMFEPEEKYHLESLKIARNIPAIGSCKNPGKHKVIIHHPYSNSIPINRNLPKMDIFTIPIKSLGKEEFDMLAEVHGENDTISVLLKAKAELGKEDGLFEFNDIVRKITTGHKKKEKYDWNNWGSISISGTAKERSKVGNITQSFVNHPFLTKETCSYNIDWKKILNDQEHYHLFASNFIPKDDEKITDFLVLHILESLIRHKDYVKCPVLIVIPEISYQCPYDSKNNGHKDALASSISKALVTIRNMGRGFTSISDTQVLSNVDPRIMAGSTIQIVGELGNNKDVDGFCKDLGLGREIKEQLSKMGTPRCYLVRGVHDCDIKDGCYWFFPPTAMHKEENYNFEEMYLKHHRKNPEEYPMENYREIHQIMNKTIKSDLDKWKAKVKKREEEQEKIEREKEESKETGKTEAVKEVKKEKKEIENKNKLVLMKLCWERFNDETLDSKERSYRKIAEKLDIKSHKTVKKYIDNYKKILEGEQSKDFEEKFLDEVKE
jgi:hypothetical protein